MNEILLPYIGRHQKLDYFADLLRMPWAMLLDSAGNDNNYNRFDILCCQPTVKLTFTNDLVKLQGNCQLPQLNLQQPLVCMREILQHFKLQHQADSQSVYPFNGGWLGYISYDFARHLEKLPAIASDAIALPQIQMGLYQWAIISDHQQQQTKLINFGLATADWQKVISLVENLTAGDANSQLRDFELTSEWQSNTSQADYFCAFDKIQAYIQQGDCYQVNFSQQFSAGFSGDILKAYQKLTQANQAPFSAFLNFTDHQILSLSPERFIESHQGNVKTQPIKGTRPRSKDPVIDEQQASELKNSQKDRAENLMIVDLLRNDLSRTAAKGSVKVSELFGHYRFASVHHLISTVESQLDDEFDNFDILATTLPGGSITGAPKIRAMQIIEELEPVRRNLYCGIIGYIDFNGNMDSNICIRTLIAKNKELYCWAGGGLVADSQATTEYQETFDKLAKILPILSDH